MPLNFADKLIDAVKKKGNPICVGIDPQISRIPAYLIDEVTSGKDLNLRTAVDVIEAFGKGIIDAVADLVPAIKLQMAFFEEYGAMGISAFMNLCAYAKSKELIVIADGKRNDIGSTAEAYARAYLGEVDVFDKSEQVYEIDALTINPYLGTDGIDPFVNECARFGKGVFILVKTSNPSAGELQDQATLGAEKLCELVGKMVSVSGEKIIGESGFSSIGAVVGATYPEDMSKLRKIMPNAIFLVPGYGAQGGSVDDIKPAFNADGLGAIINSSRGIIYAYEKSPESDYMQAARNAVLKMAEDLKSILS